MIRVDVLNVPRSLDALPLGHIEHVMLDVKFARDRRQRSEFVRLVGHRQDEVCGRARLVTRYQHRHQLIGQASLGSTATALVPGAPLDLLPLLRP